MFSLFLNFITILIVLIDSSFGGLTKEQKNSLLKIHNDIRIRVAQGMVKGQPPAADMKQMQWNDAAALKAQRWADKCQFDHDPAKNRKFDNYHWVGQNIAYWYSQNITEGVQFWFDEVKGFDFYTGNCKKFTCLHYTALVWANTDMVGCGLADCRNYRMGNMYLVCNYAPGGNIGYQRPYKVGVPCSQCPERFHCNDNELCH